MKTQLWTLLLLAACTAVLNAESSFELIFVGNEFFSSSELREHITEEWRLFVDSQGTRLAPADDAAFKILQLYRHSGFYFADVDYQLVGHQLRFTITENHRIKIKQVLLQGHQRFTTARLRRFISKSLIGDLYFLKSRLQTDAASIANFYRNQGYRHVQTSVSYQFDGPPEQATEVIATIKIHEGARTIHGDQLFQGPRVLFSTMDLLYVLPPIKGQPFKSADIQRLKIKLQQLYGQHGYPQVKIKSRVVFRKIDTATEAADTVFTIDAGMRNTVRQVRVQGQQRTKPEYIRSFFNTQIGQRYDLNKIQASEEALYDTELFGGGQIKPVPVDEHTVDLLVTVHELPDKTLTFSLGYDTDFGAHAGVEFAFNNIFGAAESLLFEVNANQVEQKALIRYTEPRIFGWHATIGKVEPFVLRKEIDVFEEFTYGGSIFLEKPLTSYLRLQLGYRLEISYLQDVESTEPEEAQEDTFVTGTMIQQLDLEFRDLPLSPTRGSHHFLILEESAKALGSQEQFFKVRFGTEWYFNLSPLRIPPKRAWVVVLAIRGGWALPIEESDFIPINKRFFAGGSSSVRSYPEFEMPNSNEWDDGGEALLVGTLELRYPIWGNLRGALFYDIGKLWEQARSYNDLKIGPWHDAIGVGLRFLTPFGPLRVDAGYEPQTDEYAVFFSIGFRYSP